VLPKLIAFDLDGTLLANDKTLSPGNTAAIVDMVHHGCVVALASGRKGSSMLGVVNSLPVDVALLTLNGAAVYKNRDISAEPFYSVCLPSAYADYLISYAGGKSFALNYYHDGRLYAVRNKKTARWIDVYVEQTGSAYTYVDSLGSFIGRPPHKAIFVGDGKELDEEEKRFRALWDSEIYIVRTWDHYLEFLHRDANKGTALGILAASYGISMSDVVAFGDAANDIPMLKIAGTGIAMKNADEPTRKAASHISPWTNEEDGVAREWERIKRIEQDK
jgi:Cof subfamily protein (haloacid dehalogenase superfamily)